MPERRTVFGPPERGWRKAFARIFGIRPDGRGTELNRLLIGYPNNHNYRIDSGKMLPSRQLHKRMRKITSLYPQDMDSRNYEHSWDTTGFEDGKYWLRAEVIDNDGQKDVDIITP